MSCTCGHVVGRDGNTCNCKRNATTTPVADLKIKTASGKVPLGMMPIRAMTGAARVFEYGARKYAKGNFFLATLADGAGERYVSGALRHLEAMQLPNGTFTPESLAARDDESGLPHLDHMICGLLMLRSIMTKDGALPGDPGIGKEPTPVAAPEKSKQSPWCGRFEHGDYCVCRGPRR